MISDKLFINLKILGKIQKNGRISKSYDGIISLEKGSYFESVRRRLTSDSRKQTLYEITNILNEVQPCIDTICNSRYMTKENCYNDYFVKMLEEMKMVLDSLIEAEQGLKNLSFTYISDLNTSANLEISIYKTKHLIRDIKTKYNYFCSLCDLEPYKLETNE